MVNPKFVLLSVTVTFSAPVSWSDDDAEKWLDANTDDISELVRQAVAPRTSADVTVTVDP